MEPTAVIFNSFKQDFLNLEIICQELFTEVLIDNIEVTMSKEPVLVLKSNEESLLYFIDRITSLREEVELNLTINDSQSINSYLDRVRNFLVECDTLIKEDEKGHLACKTFHLIKIPKYVYSNEKYPSYQEFLRKLKVAIRKEVNYLIQVFDRLNGKIENRVQSINLSKGSVSLTWNRNINDLVELIKALKLSGAINNSSNNLTLEEAYKFFGVLFGIEIKRPEDQLRQKAETKNKLFFLEELNEVFQKDMKELMMRRMQ